MTFFDLFVNWWWIRYGISSREKSWIRGFSTCCIQVLENLMIMSNSTRKSLWNFHLDFTQKFTQEIHAIILPNRAFRIKVSLTKNLQEKMKLIRYFIENIFLKNHYFFKRIYWSKALISLKITFFQAQNTQRSAENFALSRYYLQHYLKIKG